MYTIDNCPHFGCGHCKYNGSNCKRIGSTNLEFVRPWFACSPSQFHIPCNSFEPKHPEYADFQDWTNFDDYFSVYMKVWWNKSPVVCFRFKNNVKVWYYVLLEDFVTDTMIKNRKLMAVYKEYYGRTNNGCGYRLIRENVNGVEL